MSNLGETPTQFINRAFSYFNQESNTLLNGLSSRPFFITVGTNTRLFDGYGDAINFDEIKKDGWVSTQINQMELIYKEKQSALISVDFSRMNTSGIEYSTSLGQYLLVRDNNLWKLKGAFFLDGLSLGEEK
tara:strand:+ start:189 stop:581 length:393 start_codon:yes stop_codon:yes gene_type:complete